MGGPQPPDPQLDTQLDQQPPDPQLEPQLEPQPPDPQLEPQLFQLIQGLTHP